MSQLSYAIVIATRNRPEALELSIPRMLNQSRKPSQLIVIDSSDDHSLAHAAVTKAIGNHEIDLTVVHGQRGLTRQRNEGLGYVKHPIVFYPDDDSIWYPNVAKEKMAIYEEDTANKISAVCGQETREPPADFNPLKEASYRMKKSDRLRASLGYRRTQFERAFFPDPAKLVGEEFYPSFERTRWHRDHEVEPVEWMTGFRMSFRTKVIREVGFDEIFNAYSLFEDIDASFGAWSQGAVVAARKALIFHYKSPERRGNGRRLGAEQLLNKAYIVAKHTPVDHSARRKMIKYARYKTFQYRLAARDSFGKERLAGAVAALAQLEVLMKCDADTIAAAYLNAVQQAVPSS